MQRHDTSDSLCVGLSAHDKGLLTSRWAQRKPACVAVKWNSTAQSHNVVQDTKRSGSRRVVFKCSKQDGDGNEQFKCGYRCCLKLTTKKGARTWAVERTGKCGFQPHSSMCLSHSKVTLAEARLHTSNTSNDKSAKSIQDTLNKIAGDNKLPKKSVSNHVANEMRLEDVGILKELFALNWGKLDAWGEEFVTKNPGSHFHLEPDKDGHFERMFIGVGAAAQMALKTGINFSGVDGTFFLKKSFFRGGVILQLTTRDGNNQIMPLAWVIGKVENAPNYEYMAEHCLMVRGLAEYLNRHEHLVYADRHKGVPAFQNRFKSGSADCSEHLIKNCRYYCHRKKGRSDFHRNQIYRIQKQHTRAGYVKHLASLANNYPEAAEYLNKIDHARWVLYAILETGRTTHFHATNNVAEIFNSVLKYVVVVE